MKKKILIIVGIIMLLLIVGIVAITSGLSDGANVILDGINLSDISDGSYTGTYVYTCPIRLSRTSRAINNLVSPCQTDLTP